MEQTSQLTEYFNQAMPGALDFLKEMVEINSFTSNAAGVNRLGQLTAARFTRLGFQSEFVPSVNPDFGAHLVLTRKGRSDKKIGLISHLDTVFPPEEEAQNEFFWRQEGNRIYGPGTMDIKGGTVMIHLVLSALQRHYPEVYEDITWIVLLNSSEEALSRDFGDLCLKLLKPPTLAALVFEAGGKQEDLATIVTARKGRATFRVTVEGRGAHAGGHHHRGANAIVQIADTVQRIASLTDYSKDLTFNVGTISGGTVINRVPHLAVADIEMRAFTQDVYQAGVKAIMALNGQVTVRSAEEGYPCKVRVELLTETPPWPRNEPSNKLLALWQEIGRPLGIKVLREERGGLSDGNYVCHAVPTIDGLGPYGDNAHCSERSADGSKEPEYVDLTSFVPKAVLNTLAIVKLSKSAYARLS